MNPALIAPMLGAMLADDSQRGAIIDGIAKHIESRGIDSVDIFTVPSDNDVELDFYVLSGPEAIASFLLAEVCRALELPWPGEPQPF